MTKKAKVKISKEDPLREYFTDEELVDMYDLDYPVGKFNGETKPVEKGGWNTDIGIVDKCGFCETAPESVVLLDVDTYRKIIGMSRYMDKLEWLGYLVGEKNEVGNYSVSGITVPKQEVTSTTVEVKETVPLEGVVGTVHSHHNMTSFHSPTDLDSVGSNHAVTIVAANSGAWKTKVKFDLPCGKVILADAKLIIRDPDVSKMLQFIEDNKDKVEEKKYNYTYTPPVGMGNVANGTSCKGCTKFYAWSLLTWVPEVRGHLCPSCIVSDDVKRRLKEHMALGQSSQGACAGCEEAFPGVQMAWDRKLQMWFCPICNYNQKIKSVLAKKKVA